MIRQLCGSGGPGRGEGAGELERGPNNFGAGALEGHRGIAGPCPFSHPEGTLAPLAACVGRGGRVHPALGLGGPQSPVLQRQAR